MNRVECRYADMNGYCDSTACHNMNIVGNIIPKERPENMNIGNSSIWVKPHINWHTGTPTEEGWYLLAFMEDGRMIYDANRLKNGIWEWWLIGDILKWQKIEED